MSDRAQHHFESTEHSAARPGHAAHDEVFNPNNRVDWSRPSQHQSMQNEEARGMLGNFELNGTDGKSLTRGQLLRHDAAGHNPNDHAQGRSHLTDHNRSQQFDGSHGYPRLMDNAHGRSQFDGSHGYPRSMDNAHGRSQFDGSHSYPRSMDNTHGRSHHELPVQWNYQHAPGRQQHNFHNTTPEVRHQYSYGSASYQRPYHHFTEEQARNPLWGAGEAVRLGGEIISNPQEHKFHSHISNNNNFSSHRRQEQNYSTLPPARFGRW